MAIYVMQIHEGLLQTGVPVRFIDLEAALVGEGRAEVFVGGVSQESGELFRYMFRLGSEAEGGPRNYVIRDIPVSSAVCELRIISNLSRPYHLTVRLYCRSGSGQTLGVLSEHQMIRYAD